jgi:hypothetical protein
MSGWGALFDGFKAGARNADEVAAFMSNLPKNSLSDIFNSMKTADLGVLFKQLDSSKITGAFEKLGDAELTTLFKKIPDDAFTQLTSTLKQSDKATIFARLKNVDPVFANKFYPDADQASDLATALKNDPPTGSVKTGKDLPVNNLSDGRVLTRANQISDSSVGKYWKDQKLPDGMLNTKPMKGGEGYFERMKNWWRNVGKKQDENLKNTKQNNIDALDDVANSKLGKRSLLKLGLYGAGGIALLMMVYDTSNPFKAIMEGLKDIKETVQGLKEVADAAANAAQNAAKGGFDLIAWLGENWWMPAVVCLVFLIIFLISSFM